MAVASLNASNIFSNSSTFESSVDRRSVAANIVLITLVSAIIVTSILGNTMVVICIRWSIRLREESGNILLINIAIADMCAAVFVMPATVMSLVEDAWIFSTFFCDLVCLINYVLIIVSMLTLCFVALDRYAAVAHALRYHEVVTTYRVGSAITYAWLQGLAFGLTPVLCEWVQYDYWEMVCAIDWSQGISTIVYVVTAFVICFLVPAFGLATAYIKIMALARHTLPPPTYRHRHDTSATVHKSRTDKSVSRSHHSKGHEDLESEMVNTSQHVQGPFNHVERVTGIRPKTDHHKSRSIGISVIGGAGQTSEFHHDERPDRDIQHATEEGKGSSNESNVVRNQAIAERELNARQHKRGSFMDWTRALVKRRKKSSVVSETSITHHQEVTRHLPFHNRRRESRRQYSASNKAIRSLLIVVISFFICMTPFCITKLLKVTYVSLPGYINVVATVFQYCSSAINPLIYAIFRNDFRHVYKKLLKKIFRIQTLTSHPEHDNTHSSQY